MPYVWLLKSQLLHTKLPRALAKPWRQHAAHLTSKLTTAEARDSPGSISHAAKSLKMQYKAKNQKTKNKKHMFIRKLQIP